MEIHETAAFFNQAAKNLNLPLRHDTYITQCNKYIGVEHLINFKEYAVKHLNPEKLAFILAENALQDCENFLKENFPGIDINHIDASNIFKATAKFNEKFSKEVVSTYGEIPFEAFFLLDSIELSHYQLIKDPTLIARYIAKTMRDDKIIEKFKSSYIVGKKDDTGLRIKKIGANIIFVIDEHKRKQSLLDYALLHRDQFEKIISKIKTLDNSAEITKKLTNEYIEKSAHDLIHKINSLLEENPEEIPSEEIDEVLAEFTNDIEKNAILLKSLNIAKSSKSTKAGAIIANELLKNTLNTETKKSIDDFLKNNPSAPFEAEQALAIEYIDENHRNLQLNLSNLISEEQLAYYLDKKNYKIAKILIKYISPENLGLTQCHCLSDFRKSISKYPQDFHGAIAEKINTDSLAKIFIEAIKNKDEHIIELLKGKILFSANYDQTQRFLTAALIANNYNFINALLSTTTFQPSIEHLITAAQNLHENDKKHEVMDIIFNKFDQHEIRKYCYIIDLKTLKNELNAAHHDMKEFIIRDYYNEIMQYRGIPTIFTEALSDADPTIANIIASHIPQDNLAEIISQKGTALSIAMHSKRLDTAKILIERMSLQQIKKSRQCYEQAIRHKQYDIAYLILEKYNIHGISDWGVFKKQMDFVPKEIKETIIPKAIHQELTRGGKNSAEISNDYNHHPIYAKAIESAILTMDANQLFKLTNVGQLILSRFYITQENIIKYIFDKIDDNYIHILKEKDSKGDTPLENFVANGQYYSVKLLIEKMPKDYFSIQNNSKNTVLSYSIKSAPIEINKLIIEKMNQEQLGILGWNNKTVLTEAIEQNEIELAEILADAMHPDTLGNQDTMDLENEPIYINLFTQKNNIFPASYRTSIMVALENKHFDLAKKLAIKMHAKDLLIKDKSGRTAYAIAKELKQFEICEIIEKKASGKIKNIFTYFSTIFHFLASLPVNIFNYLFRHKTSAS